MVVKIYEIEKGNIMARGKKKTSGGQLDLIDVAPKNAKDIIAVARLYQRAQATSIRVLGEEIKHKQHILDLVKKADLTPLKGGKIKFEYEGVIISVTPREMLVKVIEKAAKKKKT